MSSASTINGNEKVVRIIDYYLNYCSPQGQIKTMARPEGAARLCRLFERCES